MSWGGSGWFTGVKKEPLKISPASAPTPVLKISPGTSPWSGGGGAGAGGGAQNWNQSSDGGWNSKASDGGWKSGGSDGGWKSGGSDGGWKSGGSDGGWKTGGSDGGWKSGGSWNSNAGGSGGVQLSWGSKAAAGGWNAGKAAQSKPAEDIAAKRAEAEARRGQAVAALHVRKIIQRVRAADMSTFEELCSELEQALIEKLEVMGTQAEAIRSEAESAIEAGRQRLEKAQNREAELEKKKEEAEVKRKEKHALMQAKLKEEQEKAETAAQEATDLVTSAEALVAEAAEAAAVAQGEASDDLVAAAEKTETASAAALEALDNAAKALPEKRKALAVSGKAASVDFKALHEKLKTARSKLNELKSGAKKAKERAARLVIANKRTAKLKEEFAKYDKDRDGKLSRKEIVSLGESLFGFQPEQELIDKVLKGAAGVTFEKFPRLRSSLAIEKSCLAAREKKREEEEKARIKREEEARLHEEFVAAKAEVEKAVQEAKKSLEENKALLAKLSDIEDASEQLGILKQASAALDTAQEILGSIDGIGSAEDKKLNAFKRSSRSMPERLLAGAREKVKKQEEAAQSASDVQRRKALSLDEALRMQVACCVLGILCETQQTAEELFAKLAPGGADSAIAFANFVEFLKSLANREVPAEAVPEVLRADSFDDAAAKRLFGHLVGEGEGIDRQMFAERLAQVYFRVAKSTIITDGLTVTSTSKQRLDTGVILEALDCPKTTENGLCRVHCRIRGEKEPVEGYATVKGNKGTFFLEQCSRYLICVKEAPMAEEMPPESKVVRRIAKGELLEVTEVDTMDSASTMYRTRCRCLRDGADGWISFASTNGVPFVEQC